MVDIQGGLPDSANKNMRQAISFEFYINNKNFLVYVYLKYCILHRAYLHKKLFIENSNISGVLYFIWQLYSKE